MGLPEGSSPRQAGAAASSPSLLPSPAPASATPAAIKPHPSRDGSFSLYSPEFGESFHCADSALAEARRVFVAPAQLERFRPGGTLRVLEVAVGTGTNTATLLQACQERGLELDWWGLELDPLPLQLALADGGFRSQWPGPVLKGLEHLSGGERLLWGDGRTHLPQLLGPLGGRCDLVLLDAFSPRHCPQLWSLEFLADLAGLLNSQGRLLTYCSAAAVRRALALCHLQLAAITGPGPAIGTNPGAKTDPGIVSTTTKAQGIWSAGTVASPTALPLGGVLRPLSPMELEHLGCRAGEPYRDPARNGTAAEILERRQRDQSLSAAEPSSHWQRRWGLARRHHQLPAAEPGQDHGQDRGELGAADRAR